jgi:glycosyltransferase involved in cell wall biosynthesis
VINEPVRRGRVTGTDLLGELGAAVPIDLFGMETEALGGVGNLVQEALHCEMARRRVYVHPVRWTSLGLSLLEAMHLGMPVVALATTEVCEVVPREAGFVSNRIDVLKRALRLVVNDREEAVRLGKAAREAALERYGLIRFLQEWDRLLERVAA